MASDLNDSFFGSSNFYVKLTRKVPYKIRILGLMRGLEFTMYLKLINLSYSQCIGSWNPLVHSIYHLPQATICIVNIPILLLT